MRLFRGTGYLVFSIFTVINEMGSFMVLLAIVMLGFTFAEITVQTHICADPNTPTADLAGLNCAIYLPGSDFDIYKQFGFSFAYVFSTAVGGDSYNGDDVLA